MAGVLLFSLSTPSNLSIKLISKRNIDYIDILTRMREVPNQPTDALMTPMYQHTHYHTLCMIIFSIFWSNSRKATVYEGYQPPGLKGQSRQPPGVDMFVPQFEKWLFTKKKGEELPRRKLPPND